MLSGRVSAPVLRLAQMWQDFHQARLSIDRLGDILNTAPEPVYKPGRVALPAIRGEITFDHVSFRYRLDGPRTLHDVSFVAKPGEIIGIVGSSGSGKSTLAKLIQRLYVPETGRVLVDGVDLAMVDVAWLRRQIGVVLQDNVLFNRSIRDNIALADPGMPMEKVIAAASLPARTTSSWSSRTATTPRRRTRQQRCPAGSASASPSPARSSAIRAS